ncbi:MAG: hypothetical protein WCP28_07180 [Actinomycetes bacterium]
MGKPRPPRPSGPLIVAVESDIPTPRPPRTDGSTYGADEADDWRWPTD